MKFLTGKRKSTVSINFFEQHLAQSLDELQKATESKDLHTHEDYLLEWCSSSATILHSFCAIDSLVNFLAYEYFENKNSDWYIEPENREFIAEKQLKDWLKTPFEKRGDLFGRNSNLRQFQKIFGIK